MLLPKARGAFSSDVFAKMQSDAQFSDVRLDAIESRDDAQIVLWALYELHYQGFDNVEDDLEWDPALLTIRRALEQEFEAQLWDRFGPKADDITGDPVAALWELIAQHDGPSLAGFLHRKADADQMRKILQHRSIYHLKESDPPSWTIPRLSTAPKAALLELQFDEYGNGNPNRLHAELFAQALDAAGLDAAYGAYIDEAPAEILALNNAMSLFGLHRRLRGASMGHLAAFEATSSQPSRLIAQGLHRLGFPAAVAHYYEEHIEADAVHEQLAARDICGAMMRGEPGLVNTVFFGASVCLGLESDYGRLMLAEFGDLI